VGLLVARIPKLKVGEPFMVEWEDAGYDDNDPISWTNIKDVAGYKEILIKSIGFFVNKTKTTLYFCMSMDENDKKDTNIAGKGQIPLGCIKKITKLRK